MYVSEGVLHVELPESRLSVTLLAFLYYSIYWLGVGVNYWEWESYADPRDKCLLRTVARSARLWSIRFLAPVEIGLGKALSSYSNIYLPEPTQNEGHPKTCTVRSR